MAAVQPKYHIIGAGIAGLQTAQLIRRKYPYAEIIVYEAAEHPGGRCFSFTDRKLGINLDNATHAILRGNRLAAALLGKNAKFDQAVFYDTDAKRINNGLFDNLKEKSLALFNLPLEQAASGIVIKTLGKLFPFTSRQLRVWFSRGDLNDYLIEPLSSGLNIKYGWKLTGVAAHDNYLYKLIFNKENIALLPQDKVIAALDAHNYTKIFGGRDFDYNEITNVFFRTSMQITLPGGYNFLGLSGSTAQWLFTAPGLTAVTISNSHNLNFSDDYLAMEVWKEIGALRGHAAAFLPSYRVLRHKRATIRQDQDNNARRPNDCRTAWKNMFIAGDWTMKNWPCSIEAALQSAYRVIKNL